MARSKELKKRVLITSNGLDFPRGLAPNSQGKEIGQALTALGFEPLLIPQRLSVTPEGETQGTYCGIPYDYLSGSRKFLGERGNPILRKLAGVAYTIGASMRLSAYLLGHRRTVAALFDLSNQTLPLLIEGTVCRLLGIPMVYFMWEEVCAHRVNRQSNRALRWMHRVIALIEAPLLYGIVLRLPRRITYLTDASRSYLRKWGYRDSILCDFPVVKDRKSEPPITDQIRNGHNLVFTGTINCEKDDFLTLIKAIAALRDSLPELRLHIYGSAEASAQEEILSMAEAHGVGDSMVFMGWRPLEEVDRARREALALLVLKKDSIFNRYNFPSRVLDFIDSGRPLLITDLPAHRKFFRNRHNAFVINEGDVEQLVDAIRTIAEKPELVASMTKEASALLDDSFNADKHLRTLLNSLRLIDSDKLLV